MTDSDKNISSATNGAGRSRDAGGGGISVSIDDELYLAIRVQARRQKRSDESVFDEALRDWLTKTADEPTPSAAPERLDVSVRAFCRSLDEPVVAALANFLDALRESRTGAASAPIRERRRGSAGKMPREA